jgi:hypothetical protein
MFATGFVAGVSVLGLAIVGVVGYGAFKYVEKRMS